MGGSRSRRSVAVAVFCAACLLSCRSIPTPEPTSGGRVAGWQQDLTYLRDEFPRYNNSFDERSLAQFDSIVSATLADVDRLSDNQIYVQLLQAIATPNDVHTSLSLTPSRGKIRRLPIRFHWFSDGLYVVRARADQSDLLGSRVVAIAGSSAESVLQQMRALIPGNQTWVNYESAYYMSSPDILQGMGVSPDADMVEIEFETPAGSRVMRTLEAMPLGEAVWGYRIWRELSPRAAVNMDAPDFAHLLDVDSAPLYLDEPNRSAWWRLIENDSVLYLQVNQTANFNSDFRDIARELERLFARRAIEAVVVDLRLNTGGNFLLTNTLVRGIPEWHNGEGPIYIVVGGATLSAGIVTAARLKYYAGDRAVVVGEPAAEGLMFWAESEVFVLPNSQLRVFTGHRYHNWATTDYDRSKRHFWLMRRMGVAAGDLAIDLPAENSFADYLAARDPALEAIVDHLATRAGR